jgi:hypothetical protein
MHRGRKTISRENEMAKSPVGMRVGLGVSISAFYQTLLPHNDFDSEHWYAAKTLFALFVVPASIFVPAHSPRPLKMRCQYSILACVDAYRPPQRYSAGLCLSALGGVSGFDGERWGGVSGMGWTR